MSGEWYPGATKKPLPENATQATIRPTQVIHHVTASTGTVSGTWNYFDCCTNIESHYGVDYGQAYGGLDYAWQAISNRVKADANYKANLRPDGTGALSVETRGGEYGEWTPWEVDWLVAHGIWCHRQFGIPLRVCRTWDDPGFGYHTLFGAPSPWTPVAKTCPGPDRKKQWHSVVFPRIEALDAPKEDDMTEGQAAQLSELYTLLAGNDHFSKLMAAVARIDSQASRIDDIEAKLAELGSGDGGTLTKADLEEALKPFRSLLPGE